MSEPITWTNGRLRIGDLEPREDNPRQSTKKQVARIKQSVNDFGQVDILAVGPQNDKGKYPLYNGHQRYYAWLDEFGQDYMVDVRISNRPLATEEWQALTITLHAGATGGWDWDKLPSIDTDILEGFGLLDADLLKGWQQDYFALGEMLAANEAENKGKDTEPEVSRADELQQVWQVQLGDMFACGPHRIICGDCTDRAVVERVMGGEKAAAVVMDSPYGMDVEGIKNDKEELLDKLFFGVLSTLPMENGVCVNFQGNRLFWKWIDKTREFGHKIERALWMYKPNDGTFPWRGWLQTGQMIILSSVGKPKWNNTGEYKHDTYIENFVGDELEKAHATPKPITVISHIMSWVSLSLDIVYDPFLGSGTTMVAAHQLGRRCFGIEIEPSYVAVTLERMKQLGLSPTLIEEPTG